jgi:hypothetical protein
MKNFKMNLKKLLTGSMLAIVAMGCLIYLPEDVHAAGEYHGMIERPHVWIPSDPAFSCFETSLREYVKNNESFKRFYCTDPSDRNTCDISLEKEFLRLFLVGTPGTFGALGIFEQARNHECSEQVNHFKTLTQSEVERGRTPTGEVIKEIDQKVVIFNLTVSFSQCIENADCTAPKPPAVNPSGNPTVSGIPAPSSQAENPPSPFPAPTADAPSASPDNNGEQGGGCSIGTLETPPAGSLNYAIFLALASVVRGIRLAKKYLKK